MNHVQEDDFDRRIARDPIAIVGLSALYPASRDVREFWSNIVGAVDCIQDVPDSHWKIDDYYDPDPSAPDRTYARRGGFIPPVPFAPLEFGLPPRTLEVTDVLQLLSLVVARDVLKDAGADQPWYVPSKTGVVLGVTGANQLTQPLSARLQTPVLKEVVRSCGLSERDAEEIAEKFKLAFAPWEENSFPGMLGNVVAGRVANRLDLGGTNMTIDAACASSLGATKAAISELLERRADMMLTGGCDAENTIFMYLCFSKTPAFSKNGRIRPFDKAADGTLIGEGIGMLALRRLADAERDGNRIYAVIRGIGSSSDGRFKSIYAPRKEGQTVALRRAYHDADCSPDSVELFEAHGTGTAVGDATELSALAEVVSAETEQSRFAAIGSVKSQIGHTKAAAGAAGMIKLALALDQRLLPPTINVDEPTAAIGAEGSPFYVNTTSRPWIRHPERPQRRAAISSFGFGGTNFHVVLEEHGDGREVKVLSPTARVHLWHAPDAAALTRQLAEGAAPTGGPVPAEHARVAFAADDETAAAELRDLALRTLRARPDAEEWIHPRGIAFRTRAVEVGRVGALYAGQGSQYVNAGLSALLSVPPLRVAFDEANQYFRGAHPLSAVAFPPPAFDDATREAQEARLRQTAYAQTAIGALSVGQYRYLGELGFQADGHLGHSFGELTALWAAGTLSDAAFFQLARARGEAMSPVDLDDFDPGAMAALTTSRERAEQLLGSAPELRICNHNAPDQIVVGGPTDSVVRLVEAAREAGVRAKRLPVSAAFHTPLVAHATEEFGRSVAQAAMGAPRQPVFANTPGAAYGADEAANRAVLTAQLTHPVAFAERVEEMYALGFRTFVEFGPSGVLGKLVERILGDRPHAVVSVDPGPGKDADLGLKWAVARLAVLGLPLDTAERHAAPAPPRQPPKGLTIELNGINYVSPERRAAYQEALTSGYRVPPALPAAPPAPAAEPLPVAAASSAPAGSANADTSAVYTPQPAPVPVPAPSADLAPLTDRSPMPDFASRPTAGPFQDHGVVADHLSLHEQYLTSQLESARQLTDILAKAVDTDRLGQVVEGVTAVKQHGLAIGRAHLHANEVLRELAGLEYGVGAGSLRTGTPALEDLDAPTVLNEPWPPEPRQLAPAPAPAPQAPAPQPVPEPSPVAAAPPADVRPAPAGAPAPPAPPAPAAVPALDPAAVQQALLSVVAEKTGYPTDMLELDMDVEADLGIDSIKRVEILSRLQETFPTPHTVSPEQLGELRTLADIATFMAGTDAPDASPTASAPAGTAPDAPAAPSTGEAADRPRVARAQAALAELPPPDQVVNLYPDAATALLVDDGGELVVAVANGLIADGWQVQVLRLPEVPQRVFDGKDRQLSGWNVGELGEALQEVTDQPLRLVVTFGTGESGGWRENVRRLTHALLVAKHTLPALTRAAASGRAAFLSVTRLDGVFGLSGVEEELAPLGGFPGLVKTLAIEAPELFSRSIDLGRELTAEEGARAVLAEARDAATLPQVGIVGGRRVTLTLADLPLPVTDEAPAPPEPDASDLFVVTGGARGITARCAIRLAERHGVRFLLLGRTPLGEEPAWAAGVRGDAELRRAAAAHLTDTGEKPTPKRVEQLSRTVTGQREVRETLAAIEAAGGGAEYLSVDIANASAVGEVLAPYAERVTGLVHGAGVLADQLIERKKSSEIERVVAPKLEGLRAVVAALPAERLRHVVLFSSVAGFFGNRGQSDYAMANEVLNTWAGAFRRQHPRARVTSLNWGAWDSGMVSPQLRAIFAERGIPLVGGSEGPELFVEQFAPERAADTVTVLGPTTPLSERAPRLVPTVVEESLAALADEPVVRDHVIGETPVLPAALALGWMIGATERTTGRRVRAVSGFTVHKGVVYDGTEDDRWTLALTPHEDADTVSLAIRSTAADGGPERPRYGAESVRLAAPGEAAPTAPATPLPGWESGQAVDHYADGTLFHGPALRGITRVLSEEGDRLVLAASLDTPSPALGRYDGFAFQPQTADLLLQAALVWARRRRQTAVLPLGIERVELFGALPQGRPFALVVEPVRIASDVMALTVSAHGEDGRLLSRFTGVSVVSAPQLAAKFARD
ncbi:beta keto-acyl synthase [Streptomyces sp. PT12]|nr:beta keto-acyl synthase [Streptomyces sp. PT12]